MAQVAVLGGRPDTESQVQAVMSPADENAGQTTGHPTGRRTIVLVDDATALVDTGVPLGSLVDAADGDSLQVVLVMDDTKARSNFDSFSRSVRAFRLGLLLRPGAAAPSPDR